MRVFNGNALFAVALCCLVVLSGCAGRQPKTVPLGGAEEQEAAALWTTFLRENRPQALDADIRLGWDVMGSKGGISASLQIQQPAHLRFAANDPLGRALILAVADGSSFTMVDNRVAHVSRGTIDSKFWRSYVPQALKAEDLFPLLGGFLPAGEGQDTTPSRDEQGQGFWYQWQDGRSFRHHVFLDRGDGRMRQHLMSNAGGDTLLEVQYADYRQDAKSGFVWPGHLRISGTAVTGTVTLQVEHIYSHSPKGKAAFRLAPPPHFTVEQVL